MNGVGVCGEGGKEEREKEREREVCDEGNTQRESHTKPVGEKVCVYVYVYISIL